MTVQDILRRALRLLRVLPAGAGISGTEAADALETFNAAIRGLYGHGVGPKLSPTTTDDGYALVGGLYSVDVTTPIYPKDGHRIGVIGARTVTAYDGSTIEGAASVTTTGNASWFYRADLADWVLEADRALSDDSPYSPDLDEALSCYMAFALAPEYGAAITPELQAMINAGRSQISQRYGYRAQQTIDTGLLAFPSRRITGFP